MHSPAKGCEGLWVAREREEDDERKEQNTQEKECYDERDGGETVSLGGGREVVGLEEPQSVENWSCEFDERDFGDVR